MATKQPKAKKPHKNLPLVPHATGRWAKKIRGKLHHFGSWTDANATLKKYLTQRHDLQAGRTPRSSSDGMNLRDLVNQFLTAKQQHELLRLGLWLSRFTLKNKR